MVRRHAMVTLQVTDLKSRNREWRDQCEGGGRRRETGNERQNIGTEPWAKQNNNNQQQNDGENNSNNNNKNRTSQA